MVGVDSFRQPRSPRYRGRLGSIHIGYSHSFSFLFFFFLYFRVAIKHSFKAIAPIQINCKDSTFCSINHSLAQHLSPKKAPCPLLSFFAASNKGCDGRYKSFIEGYHGVRVYWCLSSSVHRWAILKDMVHIVDNY